MAVVRTPGATTATPAPPLVRRYPRWPRPQGRWFTRAIFFAVLAGLTVIFVYPFIWTLSASVKTRETVFDNKLIPDTWQFSNYSEIFDAAPFLTWIQNSVIVAGLGALAVTLSSSLVAFGFAYFRFPGRNLMFGLVLATMMLPAAVTMIPVYLIWNELGLVNTLYPLWAMNLFGSAFYIFLLRQFFLGIPRELFEAARMDGDNFFTMFRRIALPLAVPALIVTFVFELQAKWNDLMTPLIYLRDDDKYTIPRGLKAVLDQFSQGGGGEGDYQLIIAALVMTTIPMIVIFAIFQRYFISGIATQGRKG